MPGPARAGALIYARDPGLLSHFYRTLLQMEIRSQSDELIVQENADIAVAARNPRSLCRAGGHHHAAAAA